MILQNNLFLYLTKYYDLINSFFIDEFLYYFCYNSVDWNFPIIHKSLHNSIYLHQTMENRSFTVDENVIRLKESDFL